MLTSTFRYYFRRLGGVYITHKVILLRKPLELYNLVAGKVIASFSSLDEALRFVIDGQTVEDIIGGWKSIEFPADRKTRSYMEGTAWPSGGPGIMSGKESDSDLPARMNVKLSGASRSYDDMVREFTKLHGSAGKEHGIVVDEAGFVSKYLHGERSSISGLTGKGNEIAIHNHPKHGWPNFSKEDVLNTALGTRRGIVAVSTKAGRDEETAKYAGTYSFVKGTHFNASGFVKAVNSAKIKGVNYNVAVSNWLKENQKKFGYTYSFVKAK